MTLNYVKGYCADFFRIAIYINNTGDFAHGRIKLEESSSMRDVNKFGIVESVVGWCGKDEMRKEVMKQKKKLVYYCHKSRKQSSFSVTKRIDMNGVNSLTEMVNSGEIYCLRNKANFVYRKFKPPVHLHF